MSSPSAPLWPAIVLNVTLATFVLASCANFFVPFACNGINETSSTINSWLLVISGLLINAGTLIQIIGSFMSQRNVLSFNYLACLVCGCFLLFFGQVYTYVHKMVRDLDFLISIIGSFLSFSFTLTLMTINKCNELRERRRSNTIATNAQDLKISRPKCIVYYEGTSGVGKTTRGTDHSYDFTKYTAQCPLFKLKQTLPYVQTMYIMQLYSDIALDLLEFSHDEEASASLNDRHVFSQLAYDIVFFYKGPTTQPREFRQIVDRAIFNNQEYKNLIRSSMRRVLDAATAMAPNTKIKIAWFVSGDTLFTKRKLIERGGFEAFQRGWNLEWYIENQNYIFHKLEEISEIGEMNVVRLISA